MAEKVDDASRCNVQPLTSLLKRLSEDIDKDIQGGTVETSQFLQQCKMKCSSLLQVLQIRDVPSGKLRELLQDTGRLILDYTYLDETLLVEAEFPPENARARIKDIQGKLDSIFQVAEESFEDQPVLQTLGEEIVECVRWRKGALLYMYCHTVEANNSHDEPDHYKQCLEEGVTQLEKMLSTRRPVAVPEDVSADDTLQLFSQGVYSDTHLLALIYAAELCYWHQQAADKGLFSCHGDSTFCAREQGQHHLESYLKAVKGPLKNQDWNSNRAEELMLYLRQCSR